MKKSSYFIMLIIFSFILGCSNSEFDRNGYHKVTKTRYNQEGYDINGFNKRGFNKDNIHNVTGTMYDEKGFDNRGFNKEGIDEEGYNREGYDKYGYNRKGYNKIDLDNGYSEDFLSFHYAAWFEYTYPFPYYNHVAGLTYSNNYRGLSYNKIEETSLGGLRFIEIPPIECQIKNYHDVEKYRRDIVSKEVDRILLDDNFNNFSRPKDILNRDLKIKKKLDLMWKSKKEYENDFDLIRRNLDTLEKYKKIFDTVVVFKRKPTEFEIQYDTNEEKLIIKPEELIDLTVTKSSEYIGSNIFGVSTEVISRNTEGNLGKLKSFKKIEIDIPKKDFIEHNYTLKNFIIEYLVITNKIEKVYGGKDATIDSPYSYSYRGIEVTYEVVGIKLKFNNKVVYKANLSNE